jgi:hypothetical protein
MEDLAHTNLAVKAIRQFFQKRKIPLQALIGVFYGKRKPAAGCWLAKGAYVLEARGSLDGGQNQ